MSELRIPCSPEQEEVLVEHAVSGTALGMQPDERAWIISHVRKLGHSGKISSADLDISEGEWIVTIES